MTMVGRRCTRCKGGIYTAWRTPDQQKFYHPHCFTCAICDVILDSVKECGMPNLQEIYCQDCHLRYFSEDNARRHNSMQTSVKCGEQEILKALARTTTPRSLPISPPRTQLLRERVNTSEASQSGRGTLNFQTDDASRALEHAKDGMINISENFQNNAMRYARGLERKTSRIPRPTSANSKKTLAKNTSATLSLSRTKATVVSQNSTADNRKISILPPAKHKMHRSVSLVQPHEETSQNRETQVHTSAGNSKSTTSCPGAASRPVSARSEQINSMHDYVPFSKRQCAASFFVNNHHNFNKNVQMDQTQSNRSSKSRLTSGISYPKDETMFRIPVQDRTHVPIKSPLPTTKDILNVIKRGNSDLITLKSANNHTCIRNNRTTCACKRSFKITFDCPICISSLVQGNVPLREGEGQSRGNVVTICGHLFHRDCIENWLKIKGNKRCPICSAFCLPETLQSVYMECNVSADVNNDKDNGNSSEPAYAVLRHEYDLLKAKYDEVLEENRDCELKGAIIGSLQSAYDMECRNRLQLQWDNKKLMRRIEEMQNSASLIQSASHNF